MSGENAGSVWIKSDVGPQGTYIMSVEVSEDFSFGLSPTDAMHYTMCVMTAVANAEFDAALAAQLRSIGLDLEHVAQTVNDLRNDRPPIPWRQPFTLTPGVAEGNRPFLTLELHGERIGQWTLADARSHAIGVLEVTVTCDLDNAYFRHLRGTLEVDEGRARNVVNDLINWRAD